MKSILCAYMLTLGGMAVLLAGCGGGGTTPDKIGHALTESLTCIGCHEDSAQNPKWASPGTGKSIVTEWKASTHNTKNGASCPNCHGGDFDNPSKHPLSCGKCHTVGGQVLADSSTNPDSHERCLPHGRQTGALREVRLSGYFRRIHRLVCQHQLHWQLPQVPQPARPDHRYGL